MKIRLSKAPFDSHDNILFSFIKQYLVGDRIYDKSEYAFPYTKVKKKYEITIETDNTDPIFIKYNQIDYLQFSGALTYSFYVMPLLGKNLVEVFDSNGNLLRSYQFNCYNIHIFLASIANEFRKIWNLLYQASANSYYDLERVKDLNGNYLYAQQKYLSEFAVLLGTKRYTKFNTDQYIKFLHNAFQINKNGTMLSSIYQISKAFDDYIDQVDMIPFEQYLVWSTNSTVLPDPSDSTKIKIYPNYQFINDQSWGIINYTNESPSTAGSLIYVYVDGEQNDDTSLKVKYSSDYRIYKTEYLFSDLFQTNEILNDDDGSITGTVNGKYVLLKRPIIGDIQDIITDGSIGVEQSVKKTEFNNIYSLGTVYKDQINQIIFQYYTYKIPNILAQLEIDSNTHQIKRIIKTGLECFEQYYNGYLDNNYGSIFLNIKVKQLIDDELKGIINSLIRNVIPVHIRYFLRFYGPSSWITWGQTDISFSQFAENGEFHNLKFENLP